MYSKKCLLCINLHMCTHIYILVYMCVYMQQCIYNQHGSKFWLFWNWKCLKRSEIFYPLSGQLLRSKYLLFWNSHSQWKPYGLSESTIYRNIQGYCGFNNKRFCLYLNVFSWFYGAPGTQERTIAPPCSRLRMAVLEQNRYTHTIFE